MITATPSGSGWYVEGDRYKVFVTKSGITQLMLKETGAPQTNVLYGGGIVFNEAYGATSGTVKLANADSDATLVESNSVRAVLQVSGFYEPGTGGTQYGTGSARLTFYPDRFAIESVSQFGVNLGSGMCVRPITANFLYNRCAEDYCYDTDGAGGFTWYYFYGAWAAVAANKPGPLTVMTLHPVAAAPAGFMTATVLNGEGMATLDLQDATSETVYRAWRAQKSTAVTGVRYRAVTVFTFATGNVNDPNESSAVAARDDITRCDPLDGSTNAGVMLAGVTLPGTAGDEDSDGYDERETLYLMRPSSTLSYADVRFDDRRGTTTAAAFDRPVVRLAAWDVPSKPQVFRWSGEAWQPLAEGVDYSTTAEEDEGGVGPQFRIVQILSKLSGQGALGPRFKFVKEVETPPEQPDWVLKVAGETLDMEAGRISLTTLGNSWRAGRTLSFSEAVPHTEGSWREGDAVELSHQGERVFAGDVAERRLVGAPGAEEVVYVCRDFIRRAHRVNVTDPVTLAPRVVFNAPAGDADHVDGRYGLTLADIISWLFETYADDLVAAGAAQEGSLPYAYDDLDGLDMVPPKVVLCDLDFLSALQRVLSFDPEVMVAGDPETLTFRFLRLGDFEEKSVTYNGDDKPLSALVTPGIEGRYTAYRIVGRGESVSRSAYLCEGEIEEYWGARAVTTSAVTSGSSVVIPVDNTTDFAAGDHVTIGEGAAAETTTIISISAGATITANLSKSHAAASLVTNKAYLEDTWTIERAFEPAETDSGTATGGLVDRLIDSTKYWGSDAWVGAEVTLTKPLVVQKRTVDDSTSAALYVTPDWASAPAEGDAYEVTKGVGRYRYVYSRYRVTDPAKRRICDTVPDPQDLAPLPGLALVSYKPRVWRKTQGGFWIVTPVVFDYANGVFTTSAPIASGNFRVEGDAEAAPDVRLDYAYEASTCTARYPAQGFAGTAWSDRGLEAERVRYEEDFQSQGDTSKYETLAQRLLWPLCDIAYRGVVNLGVVAPEHVAMDFRLSIAAEDGEGDPVATGLESIAALVAAVEVDFASEKTRIILADADSLAGRGDWYRALADTVMIYGDNVTTAGGSTGPSGGTYVTLNDITELLVSITAVFGETGVMSVSAGGDNGIIEVSPQTGDVVVSHADYMSGSKTPCNYAPRWQ